MKRALQNPEINDKVKVVRWDFIKLKFKYFLLKKMKLSYQLSDF